MTDRKDVSQHTNLSRFNIKKIGNKNLWLKIKYLVLQFNSIPLGAYTYSKNIQ